MLGPLLVSLLAALACTGKDKRTSGKDDAAAERAKLEPLPEPKMIPNRDEEILPESKVQVELPAALGAEGLSPPEVPLIYEDGAYSIRGLRQDLARQIKAGEAGEEVELRAWVQRIYAPPPDCTDEGDCRQPHLWIGDEPRTQGKRHQMLVANYAFPILEWEAERWADQPEVLLEVGKQYRFKGKFVRMSDTGFKHERGLLQFTAVESEGGEWTYPPGAPWHPIEVERFERENAALRERVMKDTREHN